MQPVLEVDQVVARGEQRGLDGLELADALVELGLDRGQLCAGLLQAARVRGDLRESAAICDRSDCAADWVAVIWAGGRRRCARSGRWPSSAAATARAVEQRGSQWVLVAFWSSGTNGDAARGR